MNTLINFLLVIFGGIGFYAMQNIVRLLLEHEDKDYLLEDDKSFSVNVTSDVTDLVEKKVDIKPFLKAIYYYYHVKMINSPDYESSNVIKTITDVKAAFNEKDKDVVDLEIISTLPGMINEHYGDLKLFIGYQTNQQINLKISEHDLWKPVFQ